MGICLRNGAHCLEFCFSQALGIEVGHFEEIFAPINPSYEAFFSFQTKLTTLTITGFMQILYSNDVGIIVIIERVLKMGGTMKQNLAA